MAERFNVAKEVERTLDDRPNDALRILPTLAGELMADGDEVALQDLRDALARRVLHRRPNHEIANAVLAMVRTHAIQQAAHFNHTKP
jgi:hypothetical protein